MKKLLFFLGLVVFTLNLATPRLFTLENTTNFSLQIKIDMEITFLDKSSEKLSIISFARPEINNFNLKYEVLHFVNTYVRDKTKREVLSNKINKIGIFKFKVIKIEALNAETLKAITGEINSEYCAKLSYANKVELFSDDNDNIRFFIYDFNN